jgi:hypothetical protein
MTYSEVRRLSRLEIWHITIQPVTCLRKSSWEVAMQFLCISYHQLDSLQSKRHAYRLTTELITFESQVTLVSAPYLGHCIIRSDRQRASRSSCFEGKSVLLCSVSYPVGGQPARAFESFVVISHFHHRQSLLMFTIEVGSLHTTRDLYQ